MKTLGSTLLLLSSLGGSLAACGDNGTCDPSVPNTICTIAGNGEQGLGGDDGPALAAKLYYPQDTAVSPDGELWVLDFNNYTVRAIGADGIIRGVIGNGEYKRRIGIVN